MDNLTTILIVISFIILIGVIFLIVRYNKKEWRTIVRGSGSATMENMIFGNDYEQDVTLIVQREVNTGEYRAWIKDYTGKNISDVDIDYVRRMIKQSHGKDLENLDYID